MKIHKHSISWLMAIFLIASMVGASPSLAATQSSATGNFTPEFYDPNMSGFDVNITRVQKTTLAGSDLQILRTDFTDNNYTLYYYNTSSSSTIVYVRFNFTGAVDIYGLKAGGWAFAAAPGFFKVATTGAEFTSAGFAIALSPGLSFITIGYVAQSVEDGSFEYAMDTAYVEVGTTFQNASDVSFTEAPENIKLTLDTELGDSHAFTLEDTYGNEITTENGIYGSNGAKSDGLFIRGTLREGLGGAEPVNFFVDRYGAHFMDGNTANVSLITNDNGTVIPDGPNYFAFASFSLSRYSSSPDPTVEVNSVSRFVVGVAEARFLLLPEEVDTTTISEVTTTINTETATSVKVTTVTTDTPISFWAVFSGLFVVGIAAAIVRKKKF